MTLASTAPKLELLGSARLSRTDREPWRLERKTAGLLAYLALEGATPRTTLAGLLWPDSPESTARNNLRQLLRRMRDGAGAELIAGDDPLSLAPDVSVDAAQLELESFAGHDAAVVAREGELLAGLDYEDCPEFVDWLLAERERLIGLRREARTRLIDASEQAGDHRTALAHAERLLETDPISEVVHRRVMRLHYLVGDRGAALRAFERCQAILERELGVSPMPETRALAQQIEGGERVTEIATGVRRELPLSVQRPPVLVGREAAWNRMETAWANGQAIFISGPPGVGKTRLMLDFLASKGEYHRFEGRPGDDAVPYATHARSYRQMLAAFPDLPLEDWVRAELARLLPELGPTAAPMHSEADRLRFFEAQARATRLAVEGGMRLVAVDDLQFVDAASLEAGHYVYAQHWGQPDGMRTVLAFRQGELSERATEMLRQVLEANLGALIELEPLEPEAVGALISSLSLQVPDGLEAALSRHTGGNPLFVLETLRSLIESGDLERGLPARLPLPARLGPLVARRLERLTPDAQRLARTAAVAGADFDLELAARVLELHPLDLARPWTELEAAQVVRGAGFAHDLLAEAALSSVPAPIRTLLHRRIAEHLETIPTEPARIAHHWLGAGDETKAVPHLLEAARLARANFRLTEAAEALERAVRSLEMQGQATSAFDRGLELHNLLVNFDNGARHEAVIQKLVRTAHTHEQRVQAWVAKATLGLVRGRIAEAGEAGEAALQYARDGHLEVLEIEPLNILGIVLRRRGKLAEALSVLERARHLCDQHEVSEPLPAILSNLGLVLQQLVRHPEAIASFQRAAVLQRDIPTRARVLNNLAMCFSNVGRVREAVETLDQAQQLLEQTQGAANAQLVVLNSLGNHFRKLGRYTQSLEHLERALPLTLNNAHSKIEDLYRNFARTFAAIGAYDRAQVWLDRSFEELRGNANELGRAWLTQARLLREQHRDPSDALARAQEALEGEQEPLGLDELRLEQSRRLEPLAACERIQPVLDRAEERGLGGLEIVARTRLAQSLLALGNAAGALEQTSKAMTLLASFEPDFSRAELLLTHAQALEANHRPEARTHLEGTLAWLLETADQRVPPEFRASFLTRNPINREILEAARGAGLEVP